MKNKKWIISVDLGGTKILVNSMNIENMNILESLKIKTPKHTQANQILSLVSKNILKLIKKQNNKPLGIGIASTGIVNKNKILYSVNLPFRDYDLGALLEKRFSIPVIVENDARAAAIGEYFLGEGKNREWQTMVYLTISTGIGGAIIQNGKIIKGASNNAGEFGHMVMAYRGEKCRCGKMGCIDAYASGYAVEKYVADYEKKNNISISSKRASEIAKDARNGNKVATKAFNRVAHSLGILVSNIIQEYNPNAVILDGGLIEAKDLFWQNMIKYAKQNSFSSAWNDTYIATGKLSGIAGCMGIAYLLRTQKK